MRATVLVLGLVLACGDKDDADTAGEAHGGDGADGTAGADGTGGADGSSGSEAPLSNGPGGSLLMIADCAPDDGPAWTLRVGLGSGCDSAAPDPNAPYARITVHHPDLFADPVGNEVEWSAWEEGSGSFSPYGSAGPASSATGGRLFLSTWEGAADDRPEGGAVAGWYTLTLEDGTEIGAAFEGAWCGGDPMCG